MIDLLETGINKKIVHMIDILCCIQIRLNNENMSLDHHLCPDFKCGLYLSIPEMISVSLRITKGTKEQSMTVLYRVKL